MTRSFLNRRSMMTLMATALVAPVAGAASAPRIVATTGLIADAARRMTGLDIRAIAAPPHDPVLHRPGRSDLVAIADADLVLRHGLGLERRMEDMLHRQAIVGRVIAVAELGADTADTNVDDPAADPMIAHDPALWSGAVRGLADRLAQELPQLADQIQREGAALAAEVAGHETVIRQRFAAIPAAQRVIVTEAGGFGHLGRAFGFDTIALAGLSDADSRALALMLRDRAVQALFCDAATPGPAMQALIGQAAALGHGLRPAGALLADADWPGIRGESGWHAMMTRNATRISAALAPAAPLA